MKLTFISQLRFQVVVVRVQVLVDVLWVYHDSARETLFYILIGMIREWKLVECGSFSRRVVTFRDVNLLVHVSSAAES